MDFAASSLPRKEKIDLLGEKKDKAARLETLLKEIARAICENTFAGTDTLSKCPYCRLVLNFRQLKDLYFEP